MLYTYLDWVPEMTMLSLPTETVTQVFEQAGGTVAYVTPPTTDPGGTVDQIYFVTR